MALTLHVTSYKNHSLANELLVMVNQDRCSIGRDANSDFVLPDIERIVSNVHAIIEPEKGAYYLTDKSTNGTFINHAAKPIGQGNKIRLHDGDIIKMGEYDCVTSIVEQQKPLINPVPESAMWQHPVNPAPAVHQKPLSWEEESHREPLLPITPPSRAEPAAEQSFFQPPEAIPEDWDALTGIRKKSEIKSTLDAVEPVFSELETELDVAAAQAVKHKKSASIPKNKVRSTSRKPTNIDQQAMNAFLSGAGLTKIDIEPESIVDFMHTAGQMMRELTQGYKQVLESRSNIKGEFRLGMTTIRPVENNPLKFSIDVEDALTKLLLPDTKGYLAPVAAVQEATDDLQAHQMALLAGLRAALSSLVALFDPETLEKDFQKVSAVDNLLPFKKKAQYWELFKTRYGKAAADAENDFLHFLGDEFSIAYEQQIQSLKNARYNNNSI